jgi:murein DD-endopeptidase MepM/ murein hydrolase activator NlpD
MLMTIVNRHSDLIIIYLSLASALLSSGCANPHRFQPNPTNAPTSNGNVFDDYMNAEAPPADGFDFPIGNPDAEGIYTDKATGKQHNGWYVATRFAEEYSLGIHPGEDWNGAGGGDTDLGQNVYAVANGRVIFAAHCGRLWGNVIIIEHIFYVNQEKRKIRSLYAHLFEIKVQKGQDVRRRQLIATIGQDPDKLFKAHLHLEFRLDETLSPTYWPSSDGKDVAWVAKHYAAPTEFIKDHRKLFVPQQESTLILVDQASYKMRLYEKGKRQGEYDVSFGQGKGQKRRQGDNKTPNGMYFVIHKHRGQFDGVYGKYYGGHWIKFNYPNKYDAAWGRANNVITPEQETKIGLNWEKRAPTLESTGLGGGIGFHGWINEWDNSGPRHLSWGCVVMHLYDIRRLYDRISEGAMVVVF